MPVRRRSLFHRPAAGTTTPSNTPSAATPTPAAKPIRPRREVVDDPPIPPPPAIRGTYRRIGTTIALVGAALIGGLMWYYGGVCSLDYLGDTFAVIGRFLQRTAWWQHWWIPVLISAIEIFLWPRRERRWAIFLLRLVLWLAVLAFDVLTTARGLLPIVTAQANALIADVAARQWVGYTVSGGLGFAFAYLPEKIARWVVSDLWNLWVAPLWRWLSRRRESAEAPTT